MSNAHVVEIYKDDANEWRWRRKAGNGEIVAVSGEGYQRRIDAVLMAERINKGDGVEFHNLEEPHTIG